MFPPFNICPKHPWLVRYMLRRTPGSEPSPPTLLQRLNNDERESFVEMSGQLVSYLRETTFDVSHLT